MCCYMLTESMNVGGKIVTKIFSIKCSVFTT